MNLNKFFLTLALFLSVCTVNAQDVPINFNEDYVNYHFQSGGVLALRNAGLLSQSTVNEMHAYGLTSDGDVRLNFSRSVGVVNNQVSNGTLSFDPHFPEEGDKQTIEGDRREGNIIYTYTYTQIYMSGTWFTYERRKIMKEVIPPEEEKIDNGGN